MATRSFSEFPALSLAALALSAHATAPASLAIATATVTASASTYIIAVAHSTSSGSKLEPKACAASLPIMFLSPAKIHGIFHHDSGSRYSSNRTVKPAEQSAFTAAVRSGRILVEDLRDGQGLGLRGWAETSSVPWLSGTACGLRHNVRCGGQGAAPHLGRVGGGRGRRHAVRLRTRPRPLSQVL